MSAPEIRRHDDADLLVGDIASALLDRLEAAQARGEVPQVGLTGGSIAEALHRELARRGADSSLDCGSLSGVGRRCSRSRCRTAAS